MTKSPPEGDWPAVASAVRVRMAEIDITTAQLARKAGLSSSTVRGALQARTAPRRMTLGKLSKGLGFPWGHLQQVADGKPPSAPQTPQATPEPIPVAGTLLSLPDFVRGAGLQSDITHLAESVARELADGMTPAEVSTTARFVIEVGVKMSALPVRQLGDRW